MKNPSKLLALMLTDFRWTIRQPVYARALVLADKYFRDPFTRQVARALLLSQGDAAQAVEWLRKHLPMSAGARIAKFAAWAASITAPRQRGLLLSWPGGAV